jgi:diguanylate cyclase (GGDEF)-like protein
MFDEINNKESVQFKYLYKKLIVSSYFFKSLFLIALFWSVSAYSQQLETDPSRKHKPYSTYEYKLFAAYTYNFIKHVQWGNESEFTEFHIGFIGSDNPFYTFMKDQIGSGKYKIRDKPISFERVEFNQFNPNKFQIIFISNSHANSVGGIAAKTRQTNTMIISVDSEDKHEIMINLFTEDKKIKFEFNRTNLVFESLDIGETMLKLGGIELNVSEIYKGVKHHLNKMKEELSFNENKLAQLNIDLDNKLIELNNRKKVVDSLNFTIGNQQNWLKVMVFVLIVFSLLIFTILRINKARLKTNVSLEDALDNLEKISLTDQLTGLKNRRFLSQNIDKDIAFINRQYRGSKNTDDVYFKDTSDLIFFLIDLDHFKLVNDNHGHTAGDAVLIQIKAILEQVFRETDYLVRWGGEEFLVIARFTNRNNAPELAERLRQSVELHDFDIGEGKVLKKTCSIGFSHYPFLQHDVSALKWERVIDVADHCLYAAKKSNRNAWVGLNSTDSCIAEDLFSRVTDQTQALVQSKELQIFTSISEQNNVIW